MFYFLHLHLVILKKFTQMYSYNLCISYMNALYQQKFVFVKLVIELEYLRQGDGAVSAD